MKLFAWSPGILADFDRIFVPILMFETFNLALDIHLPIRLSAFSYDCEAPDARLRHTLQNR